MVAAANRVRWTYYTLSTTLVLGIARRDGNLIRPRSDAGPTFLQTIRNTTLSS